MVNHLLLYNLEVAGEIVNTDNYQSFPVLGLLCLAGIIKHTFSSIYRSY
jgi:hypothetical protein